METATRVLIAGGMVVLSIGFILGIPMALERRKAPQPPRYLFAAHLAAIIQGGLLLALTVAVGFSDISTGAETVAAWLLVAGIALFDAGLIVNWQQGVEDGIGQNSVGSNISGLGTPLVLIGTGILVFGVFAAV